VDQSDFDYAGSGCRDWDPIEFIPQTIVEEYSHPKIRQTAQESDVCELGATKVLDVDISGYLCQAYCRGFGSIFIFHRSFVQATQRYIAPDLEINDGSSRFAYIFSGLA